MKLFKWNTILPEKLVIHTDRSNLVICVFNQNVVHNLKIKEWPVWRLENTASVGERIDQAYKEPFGNGIVV